MKVYATHFLAERVMFLLDVPSAEIGIRARAKRSRIFEVCDVKPQ